MARRLPRAQNATAVPVSRGASQQQTKPHQPDYLLTVFVCALVAVGMIMLYATGSIVKLSLSGGINDRNTFFATQLFSFGLGLVFWFIASRVHYRFWQKAAPYLFFGSFLLMLVVLIPGLSTTTNGAARWIRFGSFSFQPIEFFKLGLILYLATWLEKTQDDNNSFVRSLLPFMFILGISAFLAVVIQRDMGSGMVLLLSGLSMYLMAGPPLWLFGSAIAMFSGAGLAMIAIFPYRLARLTTFFNHKEDISGAGYHINQALIALGSGGIMGKGLGKGLQSYGYLPESTNDSIFAILGEQFGFAGAMVVVSLFAGLIYRGLRIVRSAPDSFARLVSVGITCWLGFQALINIAAMLNLIPLTGIPLPFISYGGTSMLASLIAVGILQNISKYTLQETVDAHRSIGRRDSRSHFANSGSTRRVKTAR